MKLFDLLFAARPSLASTDWTHAEAAPNLFGGHDVLGPSASIVAATFPNLLGGTDLGGAGHSTENAMGGHDYFAADGTALGSTRPNLLGGEDLIGPTGTADLATGANDLGGETLFAEGLPALDTAPTLFGGVETFGDPSDLTDLDAVALPVDFGGVEFSALDFGDSGFLDLAAGLEVFDVFS